MNAPAARLKSQGTQSSDQGIAILLELLAATPYRLRSLSANLTPAQLTTPLGAGERSFKRDLTHLIYCAERATIPIYYALLCDEPLMPRIHAERQWGKLLGYERFDLPELMAYFDFGRRALLSVLRGSKREQWERAVQPEGKRRTESVYFAARGLCLHEVEHLEDLARKLGKPLSP